MKGEGGPKIVRKVWLDLSHENLRRQCIRKAFALDARCPARDIAITDRLLTLLGPQSRLGDKAVKFQVVCPQNGTRVLKGLTLLEPQPRFGDKSIKFQVVCPQNGTAVLNGLRGVT